MSVYKLYGSGVTDALASIDIQHAGVITGIDWSTYGTLNADAEDYAAELSFASTSGFTSNDTRASITSVRSRMGLLTSGGANAGVNKFVGPIEVPVSAGERIYLHAAGTSFTGNVFIHVRDGNNGLRGMVRRT